VDIILQVKIVVGMVKKGGGEPPIQT